MPATRSRSDSHSSQPFVALPERSWKIVGVTFSRNQVSLSTLSPSFWWPAVATPQRKSSGKRVAGHGVSFWFGEPGAEELHGAAGSEEAGRRRGRRDRHPRRARRSGLAAGVEQRREQLLRSARAARGASSSPCTSRNGGAPAGTWCDGGEQPSRICAGAAGEPARITLVGSLCGRSPFAAGCSIHSGGIESKKDGSVSTSETP